MDLNVSHAHEDHEDHESRTSWREEDLSKESPGEGQPPLHEEVRACSRLAHYTDSSKAVLKVEGKRPNRKLSKSTKRSKGRSIGFKATNQSKARIDSGAGVAASGLKISLNPNSESRRTKSLPLVMAPQTIKCEGRKRPSLDASESDGPKTKRAKIELPKDEQRFLESMTECKSVWQVKRATSC